MFLFKDKKTRDLENQLTQFMSVLTARFDSLEDRLTTLESNFELEIQRHIDDLDLNDFLGDDTLVETVRDILVDELKGARIHLD